MAKVIEGLFYAESHEYVRVEGEYGYIGITDYAQSQLGNVVYVDMPEVDDEVTAGEEFGEEQPELVNADAFENWIIKVKLSDPSELDNLLDAKAYEAICE